MRAELLELAAALASRGEPFAIATVVARRPPSSARLGDAAIVTATGEFHGWVGGSCTRPTVVAEAQRALQSGEPRLIVLSPDPSATPRPGAATFPMTCRSGGSVEIHIQPVLNAPRLVVYGLSPAARALVRLASAMGYEAEAVDPAADSHSFPGATRVLTDARALESPARRPTAAARVFAVVATQGEWDEEALLFALALRPDYVGVVASTKRHAELREFLEARLDPEARRWLDIVKAPAGLDIGARAPEEIALSILAEIVQRRPVAPALGAPQANPPSTATDPVCGMSVATATAKHKAAHQGQSFFFCCGGCRTRFLAAPDRYLSQRTGA